MSSKRPAPQDGCSALCPVKKGHFEQWSIGLETTPEEMDVKILNFQNRKLGERLDRYRKQEVEFHQKIEQLEKKQANDAAVLCVVNRYWNQLNEDLNILLQKFDPKMSDEDEATSFFTLCQWDREVLGQKLAQRVKVSTKIFAKVLKFLDNIVRKNHKIMLALNGELDKNIVTLASDVQQNEKNVNLLVASLHEKNHQMSLKFSEMKDKLTATENSNEELKIRVSNLEYDLTKVKQKEEKQNSRLSALQKLMCSSLTGGQYPANIVILSEMDNMRKELEEQKSLATSRLTDLETLNNKYKDAQKLVENQKMNVNYIPESVVVETKEYKHLQSQFCILVNERLNLKIQLEETGKNMDARESELLSQLEKLRSEALSMQKKLRSEIVNLEASLAELRTEYSTLKTEFEQNVVANERAKVVDEETRLLIHSLQNYNYQLKSSIQRYKRELERISSDGIRFLSGSSVSHSVNSVPGSSVCLPEGATEESLYCDNKDGHKAEAEKKDSEQLLRKPQNRKEATLALPIIHERNYRSQRNKENALLNELEVTGQAFENMQEQNLRLIQQLREKDNVNLKIISENLQLNHTIKVSGEQIEVLNKKVAVLKNQIETQRQVVKRLEEEKEFLQTEVVAVKKELVSSQQSAETERKNAAEIAADLKVRFSECVSELEKAQCTIIEKMHSIQQQKSKVKKSGKEVDFCAEVNPGKKPEASCTVEDEVLKEELRELKELMTCPSCKIKRKGAVLTKCFHVFCFDCLKMRYDSRQRRCPECNCTFGANDFHHLYLM